MKVLTHFMLWHLGISKAETQTSPNERKALAQFSRDRIRLAEIGVWHGVTTSLLRKSMAARGTLYAIDPFPKGRFGLSFQRYIAHREASRNRNGTLVWMRTEGEKAAKELAGKGIADFDFVFIDGDHSYAGLMADWLSWSPLMAPEGIIAIHDSHATEQRPIQNSGSVRYTNDVIKQADGFQCVDVVETLGIIKRMS